MHFEHFDGLIGKARINITPEGRGRKGAVKKYVSPIKILFTATSPAVQDHNKFSGRF